MAFALYMDLQIEVSVVFLAESVLTVHFFGFFKQINSQVHNPFLFLYSPLQMSLTLI